MSRKLLIVRPTLGEGGADRVTLTLLRHLDRSRLAPTLALLRSEGALLDRLPADVPLLDLGGHDIRTGAAPLRRAIVDGGFSIVFSTSSGTNITAARACPRPGVRLVLSERNTLHGRHGALKRWWLLREKRRLYSRADCVTAVSNGVAGELVSEVGVDRERIEVVFNPVVTAEFERQLAAPLTDPWLQPEEPPVVLAAGRFVAAKRFDRLLDAFGRLRHRLDCRLIILGDGPLRPGLERQRDRLGLTAHVRMPGFVDNPSAFMQRCSLFVLTSDREGLPGVLIQAMAAGAAVVATDCPHGPREIVEAGEDGLLVPTEDGAAFTAAMERVLVDETLRRELGRAAAISARRRFSIEASLPRYLHALDPEGG